MPNISRRDFLKITALAGVAVVVPPLAGQFVHESYELTETRQMMGTLLHLSVITPDQEQGLEALTATFDEMTRLIAIFDHRQPLSPLSALNRSGTLISAPFEMTSLIADANHYSGISGGAFDISVKPVLDAYQAGESPTITERTLVDYHRIKVRNADVVLEKQGMALTLDGIAKGYIVDRAVAILRSKGFGNVLVEAGGDLAASGHGVNDGRWRIGVAHPRPERMSGYIAAFTLTEHAAATSGDYLRDFTPDRRLHHIIDPHTGVSPTELASVTVVAQNAATADALSTTLMVMSPDDGFGLIHDLHDVEALIVTKNLTIRRTAGFPFT